MICCYTQWNEAFDNFGEVVLTPTKGTVKMVAAGQYDLTMEHPIDPDGKWKYLIPERVIKAPIPEEKIENAFAGLEADVYKTNTSAALRSGPSEPTAIYYGSWSSSGDYSPGSKVSYSGGSHRNYQCNHWDASSGQTQVPPPNNGWWSPIADMTSGDPALIQLKSGSDLYYVSGPTDGWYKMTTPYGLEGYIKSSQVTYDRHLTPSQTQDRIVTEQLFRIKKVTVDTKSMTVSVTAEHVSYDLNGVLIDDVKIVRQPAAQAIAWIENSFMISYKGTIASNIIESEDRLYSAEITGRSGMYALLDPDKGVVAAFDASFRRDNWDLFVMEKIASDQGMRITYGNNMLGVNWKIGSDQLITRVVPVAKDEDGSDFYLSPTKWVSSGISNRYPVTRMERIKVEGQVGKDDGTETDTTWTAETLRAEMTKQARSRFTVDKVDQLKHEITIDFLQLGDTDEYKQFRDLQKVRLYDTVIAVDPRIDLSVSVQVVEMEYDIVNKRLTAMKLSNIEGYNMKNTAGFNVLNNSITSEKLTDQVVGGLVEEATQEANAYTQAQVSGLSVNLKSWASANFEPKGGGGE